MARRSADGIGELQAADAFCRMLANRHYENFTVASRMLSEALRHDLARVYGFCRTTDDLGDESGPEGGARLARWRDEVAATFDGHLPVHPVLFALRHTIAERALDRQPFFDLIAANVQDQTVASYATWPEIEAYCRLSAAPVGRMVLGVFGISTPQTQPLSDDVCIGLQLANFVQDVARDRAIGRTYLVQADITARGLRGAIETMCDRARVLLDSGRALERLAPKALRAQLALYRMGGLAICDAVRAGGYKTDESRPVVARAAKLRIAARAALQAFAGTRGPA